MGAPGAQVEAVDRGGTFLGSLRTTGPKPVSLGMALLEAGLAQLSDRFDPERTPGGREMVAAQERARAARLKARPPGLRAGTFRVSLGRPCGRERAVVPTLVSGCRACAEQTYPHCRARVSACACRARIRHACGRLPGAGVAATPLPLPHRQCQASRRFQAVTALLSQIWESYVPPKPVDEAVANGVNGHAAPGEAAEPVTISYARAAEEFFVQVGRPWQ